MFRRWTPSSEEHLFSVDQKCWKTKINKNLSHIVKELLKEYPLSGSPVLSESVLAQHLCSVIESAFIHGLKASYFEKDSKQSRSASKNIFPKPQFWSLILKISHAETINRVQALPFIISKIGKCRAWLRLTLNDSTVTSYLATILSKEQRSTLIHFYDSHALFLDSEQADIFLRFLQGVESVIFELSFNSSILNQWTKTPLELAGLIPPSTSIPLYMQIQSKVEINNFAKPRLSARHRGSAPAQLLREQFSKSLPVTNGDEWLKKNKEKQREETENSPRLEKTIDEEDEELGNDGITPVAFPVKDSILHRRRLIKKRRKKSFNDLGQALLGSWSSISSGESRTSSCSRGGSSSARNTPRTRSFCETPPTTVLLKNPSQMAEKDLTPRLKCDDIPEQRYLASEIPLEDGVFISKLSTNEISNPARERKNTNLVLTPKRAKRGSDSSDKTDGIEHFKSFPPEDTMERGGLEDSSSYQSSDSIKTKLCSQMPLADNYKMSFVTLSSSGPEDVSGVQDGTVYPEDTQGQNINDQGQLSADVDVMNKSTEAIDIYSSSVRDREDTFTPNGVDLAFDFSTPGRMGNSLTCNGGWSAPNTPDFEQTTTKSAQSSGFGSAFSQNGVSSFEETPVVIKLSSRLGLSLESPVKNVGESPERPEIFIRREAYLKKMGEQFKQWKERWFILRGLTLSYYKDKNADEPMGTIELADVCTISEEKEDSGADVIITMNDGTNHHLAAENREIILDWAADFRTVIAGNDAPHEDNKHNGEDIYSNNNYLNEYEIITVPGPRLNGTSTSWYASMMAHMRKIANEKGLDSQNYQCADCASPIGIIYGAPRVCNFTGQYYCSQCHANEETQIPARIIHNWDFRKHKVSKRSKTFIRQVFSDPLINLNEINPGIYKYIDEMGKFLQLRQQIVHLEPYLQTCRSFRMEDVMSKLTGSRLHFLDDCQLYSIKDLCDVHDKPIANTVSKIVNMGTKHVYDCNLCSAKGFLCEICQKDEIIFPFQIDLTIQCFECKSVFHRECKNDSCPKCDRRQQRLMEAAAGSVEETPDDFENFD